MNRFNDDARMGIRDVASFCEIHPHDLRRAPSRAIFPKSRGLWDCNQTWLAPIFMDAVEKEWALW